MDKAHVIDGPDKGKCFILNEAVTSIGKASDNDICLLATGVSPHHAKLLKKNNKIFIVDVSGLQGVFMDGEKIEPDREVELKDKSNFTVGKSVLYIQRDSSKDLNRACPKDTKKDPSGMSEPVLIKDGSRNHTGSLELLLNVSNILAQSLNIQKLFGEVIDQIFNLLKRIDRGAILLLNKETGKLEEVFSKTRMGDKGGPSAKIKYSGALVDKVLKEGRPIMIPDTTRPHGPDLLTPEELGHIMSVMSVPLKYKGEVQGVIYVDSTGSPNGFRKDDLHLLTGLADTAAIAIQNARLYEALNQELAERKRAEEELGSTVRELEETRDMLVQSEKLAAIGRLAAAVAHEVLNPVNIMSMRLQLMDKREDLPIPAKNALRICKGQLYRITQITRDLAQYSRSPEKHIAMTDLNKVIERVLTLGKPQLKENNVETDIHYHDDLPSIPADKDRIEQVFFNLILNATEAMAGQKEKTLRIMTKPSNSKDHVQAIISDTGTGIDQSHLSRIFDPFFTTKEPGQGTGLGLFISYGIVHEHGGRIWAENNESRGTSFFVELPLQGDSDS